MSRQDILDAEAETFIGKPCIFVSNEWAKMVVGVMERIDTDKGGPVCTVFDYIRMERISFIGFPFHYNVQRLLALTKLDPYERVSIVYGRVYDERPVDKSKSTDWQYHRDSEIHDLRYNGFFKHLRTLGYDGPDYVLTFGHDGAFD